jgi:rSAM/selenodomain-associated transferase 2
VTISIIIPTLNESSCLAETLRQLREMSPHEILVVDGASSDGTLEQARLADRVLTGVRGRAAQMNLGAEHSTGEILLFLHADCTLEGGSLDAVRRYLAKPWVAAGCFQMTVSAPGSLYRMIDAAATARVRFTGLVYGDQGLFVHRSIFRAVGGFPTLRLMEDVFLSKRLRQYGRIVVAPKRIFVSDRRWRKVGVVRQTLHNWALTALAVAGVHPDRLAGFYPAVR